MIDRKSVLHLPMSQFAYGLDEHTVSFTIRVAHNNLKKCTFMYGDTACRKPHVDFFPEEMTVMASDELFDYYNATFKAKFHRICYYFKLESEDETKLYYGDLFYDEEVDDRSEYYKLPFVRREDIVVVPDWVKHAVVYNVFPDSFASQKRGISLNAATITENGMLSKGLLGGTINGIRANLDYIKGLGFNTLYLNPIFRAGEYHKYDLLDYYSIDPVFGTNDEFRALVDECHANDMKIIIDGVFNHCGWHFFAFEDVVKNGKKSKYWDWFYRLEEPVVVPDNFEDIPTYECFAYERMMPKMNTSNKEVENYFVNVGKSWVEEYDIDGWRLDVADEVNDAFWRRFHKEVKEIKPSVVIIGEVWQTATHWLDGTMFDSVMNYDFRKHCKAYFDGGCSSADFNSRIVNMLTRYRKPTLESQLNLLDSHDVPRFRSTCYNEDEYKMAVVFQMSFCGAPSVFYGDEQGFVGERECEYRQPMKFDNRELPEFFKTVIEIRKQHSCLTDSGFVTEYTENDGTLYIFSRKNADEQLRFIFNTCIYPRKIESKYLDGQILFSNNFENGTALPCSFAIIKVK